MSQIELYTQVHSNNPGFGKELHTHFTHIASILMLLDVKKALDFGCGKGVMADRLSELGIAKVTKYDPAIPAYNTIPKSKFDCVLNTDVMEHIPESEIPGVLDQFKKLAPTAVIIPHLGKAHLILPNGENAHCTIKTPDEWKKIFEKKYKYVELLSHFSNIHALFVCSDHPLPGERLSQLAQLMTFARVQYSMKNFAETSPLKKRIRQAWKLVKGAAGFKRQKY